MRGFVMDVSSQKDRSSALVAFGVVQLAIAAGCATLLFTSAMRYERAASAGVTVSSSALASSVFVWGAAATYFAAAGIGSMRARRWARALSVAVSGLWLAGGVAGTIAVAILLPRLPSATAPLRTLLICAAVLIALPLVLFKFYNRLDVGITCDRRDPGLAWTDRVPLPVLALIVVMIVAALWLLVNLGRPVVPVFGTLLTGAAAPIAMLAIAGLCGNVAVQLYRLKESAWWTLVLLQVGGCAVTLAAMLRAEGAMINQPLVMAFTVATWLAYFAFLGYVRRYFVGGRAGRPLAATA